MQTEEERSRGTARAPALPRLPDVAEVDVADAVLPPVAIVEVPPLVRVHREAFRLHRLPQEVAASPRLGGAARVGGRRAVRHLVELAGHLDLATGLEVVQAEVDRATPVVLRAFCRVGHE